MTLPNKDVPNTRICRGCEKEKPITSFYRNNLLKTGYEIRCKLCKNGGIRCRKKGDYSRNGRPVRKNDPQLFNVRKPDWIETYVFLKKIGYSLEENIHEQFCRKYNLPTKKRTYEKSVIYSPQDLGLV